MDQAILNSLLADHQHYHSDLQMDSFILRMSGGTTAYGQYKQCLRELHKRWRGLKQLESERELLRIDIVELTDRSVVDHYEKQRNAVRLKQKQGALEEMESNIRDTEREFAHFYERAVALKKVVGELTPGRRAVLDQQMWVQTIREKFALEKFFKGGPSMETAQMIFSLPVSVRKGLLESLKAGVGPVLSELEDCHADASCAEALPCGAGGEDAAGVAGGVGFSERQTVAAGVACPHA